MLSRPLRAFCLAHCFLATFVFLTPSIVAQETPPKLTKAQWQADVRFLGDELPKRHRNAFHRVTKEEFDATVKSVYDSVPSASEDEIIVGLMKIVAKVHDGHTNVIPRAYFRSGVYPIGFYLFSDGLYIRKAAANYAEMLGGKVVRVGNMNTDEALKALGQVSFADNEMGVNEFAPVLMSVPEVLAGLGIVDDKQKLDVVIEKDGKQRTFTVAPTGAFDMLFHGLPDTADAAAKTSQTPLYMRDPRNIYWFEYLKDQKILYVKHNEIGSKQDEPIDKFYERVFAFVDANPVDKFVLDLRNNGGGNNGLNIPVVVGLIKSKINKRGKLFVITGRETFSAAQNLVNQIEKYTEAIFVGEPTAGHPNHYGDNRPFTLPNSGLTVRASSLWWQDLDPRDARPWTAPEIAAELSFSDYKAGKDPALQAVIDYVPGSTLSELIQNATNQTTLGDFTTRYKSVKADPKSKYVNSEAAMNRFGYTLLRTNRVADAVEVFKLNAEAYPRSPNVFDSLGDALDAAGKKDEAIKSYERALAIDPNYPSSLAAVQRLKGKQ
jgi:tetratricopeptide (TPR) repeat protein